VIGEFLARVFKLGTLACLNVTNRLIHEATSPLLWTSVTLDAVTPEWTALLQADMRGTHELLYHITPTKERYLHMARETVERWKAVPGALPENRRFVKYVFESICSSFVAAYLLFTLSKVLVLDLRLRNSGRFSSTTLPRNASPRQDTCL
jgi:hypothetical protein